MAANPFRTRITRVKRALSGEAPAALFLSSAASQTRNRDTHFPYRQDSDFFYLTGVHSAGFALLVSSELKAPLLFAPPVDPVRVVWEGAPPPAKKIAGAIGAELIIASDIRGEARRRLKGIETLYYQNAEGSTGWKLASELIGLASHQRRALPLKFIHSDAVLAPLRMHKDRQEIEAIRTAARITNAALFGALPLVQPGSTEVEIAGAIEFYFRSYGAVPSFNSIVASGASAATLHHERLEGKLRAGDMLLLDVGAEHNLYAGDITRVLPVSGKFDALQKEIYEIVLAAQLAAIRKIRPGVPYPKVHEAAAAVLRDGLIDLGVLKGSAKKLAQASAEKSFFPHSIGHLLGLDVHDIGRAHAEKPLVLEAGMVLTIEPGLYFSKRTGKIPACGVRIEDDVLVTRSGPEILSEGFPKEVAEVQALFT